MEQTMGKRISAGRKALGLTQDQMAEKLGVTPQAVSKWENDQSCPDITMLPRLAKLLGITTDTLLGVEQPVAEAEPVCKEESKTSSGKWEISLGNGKRGSIALAVWIILFGSALLYSNMKGISANFWDVLWPTGLMIYGLGGLWPSFSCFRLGCLLFGVYYTATNLELLNYQFNGELVFPVLVIVFGAGLLLDALVRKKGKGIHITHEGKPISRNVFQMERDRFCCDTAFNSEKREIAVEQLCAGKVDVVFGELTVDLTQCGSFSHNCTVKTNCNFAELTFVVPRNVRVRNEISGCFVDMEQDEQDFREGSSQIILTGTANFSEISVEYESAELRDS